MELDPEREPRLQRRRTQLSVEIGRRSLAQRDLRAENRQNTREYGRNSAALDALKEELSVIFSELGTEEELVEIPPIRNWSPEEVGADSKVQEPDSESN